MKVNGLILAAGMSTRMKEFKPLMKIGERTMIETTVLHMFEAGVDQVTVVVGFRGYEVKEVLKNLEPDQRRLQIVENPAYATTQMLDSIQIGLSVMGDCDGFFLTPGDMPAISTGTYRKLLDQAGKSSYKLIFPVIDGYRKHPPFISSQCRDQILEFRGEGLRALWKEYEGEILELPMQDEGCTMDADYQADFMKICRYMLPAMT